MKMNSRIGDGIFITLLILSLITLLFFVVWAVLNIWIPAVIMLVLLVLIVIPVYFWTYYDIDKDVLKINYGLFLINYKIDYHTIISMTDVDKYSIAPALSYHRICIRYIKNGKIKSILISPVNKDKFRELVHAQIQKSMEQAKSTPNVSDDAIIQEVIEREKMEQAKKDAKVLAKQAKIAEKERRINEKELNLLEKRAIASQNQKEKEDMKKAVDTANKVIDNQNKKEEQELKLKKKEENKQKELEKQKSKADKKVQKTQNKQSQKEAKNIAKTEIEKEKKDAKILLQQQKIEKKQQKEELKQKEKQAKIEKKQQKELEKRNNETAKELNIDNTFNDNK